MADENKGLDLGDVIEGIVDAVSHWWDWNFAGGKERAELEELKLKEQLEQQRLAQQIALEREKNMLYVIGGVAAVGLTAWAISKR